MRMYVLSCTKLQTAVLGTGLAARRRRDSGMIHAFCLAAPERCAVARGLMATLSAHVVAAMQAEHRRLVVSLPTRFSASMSQ